MARSVRSRTACLPARLQCICRMRCSGLAERHLASRGDTIKSYKNVGIGERRVRLAAAGAPGLGSLGTNLVVGWKLTNLSEVEKDIVCHRLQSSSLVAAIFTFRRPSVPIQRTTYGILRISAMAERGPGYLGPPGAAGKIWFVAHASQSPVPSRASNEHVIDHDGSDRCKLGDPAR